MDDIEENKDSKKKCLQDENYKYWRVVQREQLGVSANLYFVFSSAIFGFTLNFLFDNKSECLCFLVKLPLYFSLISLLISICYFAKFTENRLKDFRETSRLYGNCKTEKQVLSETNEIGKRTWKYYYAQVKYLKFGFIFSLCGFVLYLFF
ncbi:MULTISPECIES: hypothetical protein [unclassified Flavobacterium]|jgi:hypothetical protein|uniref:hypothetical protein n=1 Tax=unclassified Flavobacterium TaxID=196869 RepID=UPI0025B894DE|nr:MULTISPECIES: hypothetical protein [unclassified Flavobacterium]